ncbi:MAG: alpha-amylase, partial [Bacteroidia bacterium]|nr:alpha-amylase [Bacteroidia bacterium]
NNGLSVLLDYVANHVHEQHSVYQKHKDWVTPLYLPDGTMNTEKWDEERLTTWFDTFLPTLDLENQEVTDFMVDSALHWITEYDFDGFRHDATKHIPNNFWRTLNKKVKKVSQEKGKYIYQIGETYGDHDLINSYIGSGLLDAQFDFNMYDNALPVFATQDESMTRLGEALEASLSTYGHHHLMGNITGNQDKPRFMGFADGTLNFNTPWMEYKRIGWKDSITVQDKIAYRKMALFNAFNMTIPGIPIIYYGDEIGMTGAGDPDNRRMMRFENLKQEETDLKSEIEKLIDLRNNNLALTYGDFVILQNTDKVLQYKRKYFDNEVSITLDKETWTYTIDK